MFDSSLIVQSAVSSFNNAALVAPVFFWSALLSLPLFMIIYMFGDKILERFFPTEKLRGVRISLCIEVVIFAWLVLMSGNYAVLRDPLSVLPFLVSGTLFALAMSVAYKIKALNMPTPQFWKKLKRPGLVRAVMLGALIAVVGFSGLPTWYGFLLQSAAVLAGIIIGFRLNYRLPFTEIIMFAISVALLMQPEFFRFGQLGSLTALHLLSIAITGILAVAVVVLKNVNPRGGIYNSAFSKLKLLMRVATGLFLVLFILTESVPVFLGLLVAVAVMFAMSVWHAKSVPENLSDKILALLICSFGVMISLPIITALGVLYLVSLPRGNISGQSKFLL